MNANSEDATVFCPLEGENVRVAEACVDCPYWDGSRCEALSRSPKRSAKKLRSRQRRTSFTTRGGGRARMPLVGGKWPFGRAAHEEGIISGSSLIPQPPDYTGADRFFEEPEVEVEPEDDDDEKEEIDRGVVGLERPMGGLTYREELELERDERNRQLADRLGLPAVPEAKPINNPLGMPMDAEDELPGWPRSDETADPT